ncbi:hypothetical protein [Streptomyces californicus]|uniref:hypothetical protein n=1 Tax=Streptomyces californicus TaxID=67351 RepID=UPI0033C04522
MSVRVFRYVHEQRSHRTVGGTVAPPQSDAARWAAMLEAAAIDQGLPPAEGQALYEAWVDAERPADCTCAVCLVVRRSAEIHRAREAVGVYRDSEGFWVFPNGLPPGEEQMGPYQVAEGVWVDPDEDCSNDSSP